MDEVSKTGDHLACGSAFRYPRPMGSPGSTRVVEQLQRGEPYSPRLNEAAQRPSELVLSMRSAFEQFDVMSMVS